MTKSQSKHTWPANSLWLTFFCHENFREILWKVRCRISWLINIGVSIHIQYCIHVYTYIYIYICVYIYIYVAISGYISAMFSKSVMSLFEEGNSPRVDASSSSFPRFNWPCWGSHRIPLRVPHNHPTHQNSYEILQILHIFTHHNTARSSKDQHSSLIPPWTIHQNHQSTARPIGFPRLRSHSPAPPGPTWSPARHHRRSEAPSRAGRAR